MQQTAACGFEIESPSGWIFEVGNGWITRRIQCIGGRIGTTSLSHGASGEEYLQSTTEEFSITLSRGDEHRDIGFREFEYKGHSLLRASDEERLLRIDLDTQLDGHTLLVSVYYQSLADTNYLSKWIDVKPASIPEWFVESITIENLKLLDTVEGVIPLSRYTAVYPSGEDNVHVESDKVKVEDRDTRFSFGTSSRAIVAPWGLDEGLFFFTASLLGSESFERDDGLKMSHKDYSPLTEGTTTGKAVIGAYSGPPEIGFKRYNEFLTENWLVIGRKSVPVSWNTWFVTLKNNVQLLTEYERNFLLHYVLHLKEAGFYDVIHLDLGWESGKSLSYDKSKFPHGMDEIVSSAKENGLDMAFWINPFSSSYWVSDIEHDHPEWLNPDVVSGNSRAHAICHMTDYFHYVKEKMVELVTRYNARVIYWDGHDWNIPVCKATNHGHRNQHELEVAATKRLAEIADAVRSANPNAMFVNFCLPFNNHRLSAVDQEQVSDTHYLPLMQNVLSQRQQIYQMTFEHPYRAIWGSWYGVDWIARSGEKHQKPSLREMIHAEMSMIANGANQAGGGFDLREAKPEFIEFLRRMFAFRKRFERYFDVYQHILGFPDGKHVDGEGHIIDGRGFLLLVNPAEEEQTITLPLNEPELELSVGHKYEITDWSSFEKPRPLSKTSVRSSLVLDIAPLEVKIIGIDIED